MSPPRGLDPNKNIPLNIFLRQEIEQLQRVLDIVRKTMNDMVAAIDGTIIMTAELVGAINQVYDFLDLVPIVNQTQSNEWILKLINTNLLRAIIIKRVKIDS